MTVSESNDLVARISNINQESKLSNAYILRIVDDTKYVIVC